MRIARQSIVRPLAGQSPRVEKLLDELDANYAKLPGYILGFRYRPELNKAQLGRIAVWRSQEDANHAAMNTHIQSIRAQINTLVEEGHTELVLEIEGTPQNVPLG